MAPDGEAAIVVSDLVKTYGATKAVDGVSLTVAPGEVFGLLGPNGAGKTTTVETLEGYRRPDGGTVRVLGLDPWRDGDRLHPQVGVMLQEGGLYPGLRPRELLALFAAYYEDPDDPDRLLALVDLDEVDRRVIRRLSGGQRQRLSLAAALIGRPRVVFLDEPTAGMDPRARATTWRLVRELARDGTTIVLTTHGMDEAEHLCDRLAIIDRGRIVALGSPREITSSSLAPHLAFSTTPGLDSDGIAGALGLQPGAVRELVPGEYSIEIEPDPATIASLAAWLRDRGALLSELRTGRRSLEEVFLRLTAEGGS